MIIDATTAKSISGAIGSLAVVVFSSKWWANRSIKRHDSSGVNTGLDVLFKKNSDLTDRYLIEIGRLETIIAKQEAKIAQLEEEKTVLEDEVWKLKLAARPV